MSEIFILFIAVIAIILVTRLCVYLNVLAREEIYGEHEAHDPQMNYESSKEV
jgi:hypothetical protein